MRVWTAQAGGEVCCHALLCSAGTLFCVPGSYAAVQAGNLAKYASELLSGLCDVCLRVHTAAGAFVQPDATAQPARTRHTTCWSCGPALRFGVILPGP